MSNHSGSYSRSIILNVHDTNDNKPITKAHKDNIFSAVSEIVEINMLPVYIEIININYMKIFSNIERFYVKKIGDKYCFELTLFWLYNQNNVNFGWKMYLLQISF